MVRLLLSLILLALPATAQEIPACTREREGAVACLSGKLCACRFERGGSVAGRPDGHRWDCGALRPACGEALSPPGLLPGFPQPLPQLLFQLPAPEAMPPMQPMPPTPPMTPWPWR